MNRRLQKIRLSLGYSQNAFSKLLDMPQPTYSYYERADRKISAELLFQLYKKFNINANYIISGEGEPFITSDNKNCNEILPYEKVSLLKETIAASIDKILLDK